MRKVSFRNGQQQISTETSIEISKSYIQNWLQRELSDRLGLEADEIEFDEPFINFGLDSAEAVVLSGDLSELIGKELEPTLLWDHPTIEELAEFISNELLDQPDNDVKSMVQEPEVIIAPNEAVAIIGVGCRFPGANNKNEFWRLLCEGIDAITEVPKNRWDVNKYYDPKRGTQGKMNTKWGGFIDNIDKFDPHFFGITPREAEQMDPQQRVLLEVAWEALEDAGQVIKHLAGSKTGTFVGVSTNDYGRNILNNRTDLDIYPMTGNSYSIVANRLSYLFDFQGPSIAIDTACSSSLTAVHLACQSILNGESEMALAGGVNLILTPEITIGFSKAGMMASDGRCKTFDHRADGYVRGEGAGIVILKPLAKALEDNDPIYAVIRGSAINQDGRSNGLTAPNGKSQQDVLKAAYKNAHISPSRVGYIEAHGTGTPLGDPIEVKSLAEVIGKGRDKSFLCKIGSVKTNIGHLESAAGIAGLIKVALALKNKMLPKSLHFETANPKIPFDSLPIQVQTELEEIPASNKPFVAGISSFGFGGTNVHVVLEEAPMDESVQEAENDRYYFIPVSAHNKKALQERVNQLKGLLNQNHSVQIADLAYSTSIKRSHLSHRVAFTAKTQEELKQQLDQVIVDESQRALSLNRNPVFVFSGQGVQWWPMGQELYRKEKAFQNKILECEELILKHAGWSLIQEMMSTRENSRLEDTMIAQPVIFAVQAALLELWKEWGIEPVAVLGHSMGEITAAYCAGVFDLEESIRLVLLRGKIMQQIKGQGRMAAVGMAEEEVRKKLIDYEAHVNIAVINDSSSVVLAGDSDKLAQFIEELDAGVYVKYLTGDYAFHSYQTEVLVEKLKSQLGHLTPKKENIPIYSTVTGSKVEGENLTNEYWALNMRRPVLFSFAIRSLIQHGHTSFLEVGPHPVLSGSISRCLSELGEKGFVHFSMKRQKSEQLQMLETLGQFYTNGYDIKLENTVDKRAKFIDLPTYPWQREYCWFENKQAQLNRVSMHEENNNAYPLLGKRLKLAMMQEYNVWEKEIDVNELDWLNDHKLYGKVVLPGSAMIEMVMEAMKDNYHFGQFSIHDLTFNRAILLSKESKTKVQVNLSSEKSNQLSFFIYSEEKGGDSNDSWILHTTGKVSIKS